jgi:hypothetical protein
MFDVMFDVLSVWHCVARVLLSLFGKLLPLHTQHVAGCCGPCGVCEHLAVLECNMFRLADRVIRAYHPRYAAYHS